MLIRTLRKYEVRLKRVGISLLNTGLLRVDEAVLDRNLEYHPEYFKVLFQVDTGLLDEMNRQFKSIQTHPNQSQFKKVKNQITEVLSRGSIIDEKS